MVEIFGWRLFEEDRLFEEGSLSCNFMFVVGFNYGGKIGVFLDVCCIFWSGKFSYYIWWVVWWLYLRVVWLLYLMGSLVIRFCCEMDIRIIW